MPSAHSSFAVMPFSPRRFCTPDEQPRITKATGSTHNAATAMRQSKKNRLSAISVVEIREPISSGIQWEDAVSNRSQSLMMALVRSVKSRLPKKDSGSWRSFSAREIRRTPLSL